jgi:hypothetical protein
MGWHGRAALLSLRAEMRGLLLIVLVVALAAGCSKIRRKAGFFEPPPPMLMDSAQWQHESKSYADFDRDDYECRRENPSRRKEYVAQMRERCMRLKGWTPK